MYYQGRHYSHSESLASDSSDVTSRATTPSESGYRLRPLEIKLFDSIAAEHQEQPGKFVNPYRDVNEKPSTLTAPLQTNTTDRYRPTEQLIHGSILINDEGEIDRPPSKIQAPIEAREPNYSSQVADRQQTYSQTNDQNIVPWMNPYWTNTSTTHVPSTFTPTTSKQSNRRRPQAHDYGSLPSFYQPIFSPLTVPSLAMTRPFGKDDNPSVARYHSSLSTMPETTVHFIDDASHLQHTTFSRPKADNASSPQSTHSNGFPVTLLTQLDLDTIQNALQLLETNPEAIRTVARPSHEANRRSDSFSAQMPRFRDAAIEPSSISRPDDPRELTPAFSRQGQFVLI